MYHNDLNSEPYSAKLTALDRTLMTGAPSTLEDMITSDLKKIIYVLLRIVKQSQESTLQVLAATN